MFKTDKADLHEAEKQARLTLCDIISALSTMPQERVPIVLQKLDEALRAARADVVAGVAEEVDEVRAP